MKHANQNRKLKPIDYPIPAEKDSIFDLIRSAKNAEERIKAILQVIGHHFVLGGYRDTFGNTYELPVDVNEKLYQIWRKCDKENWSAWDMTIQLISSNCIDDFFEISKASNTREGLKDLKSDFLIINRFDKYTVRPIASLIISDPAIYVLRNGNYEMIKPGDLVAIMLEVMGFIPVNEPEEVKEEEDEEAEEQVAFDGLPEAIKE